MKKMLLFAAAALIVLTACKTKNENAANDNHIESNAEEPAGVRFADLEMNDLDGNTVRLSDYAGKGNYVLVDFWASWCGPCRREMPTVVEGYKRYHDRGFDVVGVSLDKDASAWRQAVKNLEMTWHHMSDLKGWECAACEIYGINAIPSNVLIDPQGMIIAADLRGEQLLQTLAAIYPQP